MASRSLPFPPLFTCAILFDRSSRSSSSSSNTKNSSVFLFANPPTLRVQQSAHRHHHRTEEELNYAVLSSAWWPRSFLHTPSPSEIRFSPVHHSMQRMFGTNFCCCCGLAFSLALLGHFRVLACCCCCLCSELFDPLAIDAPTEAAVCPTLGLTDVDGW